MFVKNSFFTRKCVQTNRIETVWESSPQSKVWHHNLEETFCFQIGCNKQPAWRNVGQHNLSVRSGAWNAAAVLSEQCKTDRTVFQQRFCLTVPQWSHRGAGLFQPFTLPKNTFTSYCRDSVSEAFFCSWYDLDGICGQGFSDRPLLWPQGLSLWSKQCTVGIVWFPLDFVCTDLRKSPSWGISVTVEWQSRASNSSHGSECAWVSVFISVPAHY